LIFNAFSTLFTVPPGPLYFSWPYTILSIVFALVATVGPAAVICLRILRETPASAMRPLAPRPGKRTVLERIKPLWSRLSFLHKITARNLLRYKKRGFMTVLGVAGCTALIFTGFGLHDSLATIGPKQYDQIEHYDVAIVFRPTASTEELDELFSLVGTAPELSSYTLNRRETVDVVGAVLTKNLALIVAGDTEAFPEYFRMKPRATGLFSANEPLEFGDGGVIISEQIAHQLDVAVGDTITLRNLKDEEARFEVSGISENYVYHYVYMTVATYEQGFGKAFEPNQILGMMSEGFESMPDSLTGLAAVTGVGYTQKRAADFADITDVLSFVMIILILSSAALLFVVLFSLNTINREERVRELASIKVLGFLNRELAAYIYREGIILTVLGIALGLLFGIALERYLITTIEVDVFMFSRDLLLTSYVYSVLITAAFAVVINLLLYRPLTRIDMVASLKAIE
ncbi:MAG: ABC transporter permease, partial [Coriobacteriales bacterium]|nr:ABC transporter permease [Coriobacteriales bacterium]